MQISILGTDGAYLANNGSNAISILGPDGNLLPNDGTNYVRITDSTGADKQNDGTVPAYSILGTDGALKPNTGNAVSILNVDGSIATDNMAEFIKSKFAGGEAGAWYDPSDLSTMFQERTGETPVTATGQTVGLILDKRLGLVLGANAFSGLAGAAGVAGTETIVASSSLATSTCTVNGVYGLLFAATAAVVGTSYRWDITISANSAGKSVYLDFGGITHTLGSAVGTKVVYTIAATSTAVPQIYIADGLAAESFAISSAVVRTIAGNHAYQATGASRPIFRDVGGLRYLEFDGVDDYLRAAFTIAQPIDRISAIQQPTWANGDRFFDGVATNAATLFRNIGTPRIDFYSGTTVIGTSNLALGVNGVITERHNGATSRMALNNETYTTGDASTSLPGGITIGASSGGFNVGHLFLYQMIERGSTTAMTDAEITLIRNYMREKTGYVPDWRIRALFSASQQGAWYDPSDLSTMFQTSTGTTPVTATGQSVGLILDKRLGLALGTQLVTNGDFSQSNVTGWVGAGPGPGTVAWSSSALQLTAVAAYDQTGYAISGLTVGQFYEVRADVGATTFNTYFEITGASPAASTSLSSTARSVRLIFRAGATTCTVIFVSTDIQTATIDNVSVTHIAGNHAYQTTSASRPVFRDVAGLRYLEFDGVDDYLRATFTIAQPIDRISAIRQSTWTSGDMLFAGSGVAAGSLYQITGTPRLDMSSGGTAITLAPQLALSTNGVITERHNGASSRLALNSGAYATADAGSTAPAGITIGANQSAGAPSNMLLYQLIMRGGTALTDLEIYTAKKLAGQKSGVLI